MDSAIVPQKATAEVRPAPNTLPTGGRADGPTGVGFCSIAPRLPARTQAQMKSAAPTASRNGEPQVSRNLIESMPRSTIHTFIAQHARPDRRLPGPSLIDQARGQRVGRDADRHPDPQ